MSTPTQRLSSRPEPPFATLALAALVLTLAGCATRAPAPPPDVMSVPDAVPALEAIRQGGPNKPYAVLGETYTPLPAEAALSESGLASWYGPQFHGRRTASGEIYDMYAMTAAHRILPLPSFARISNPANGRSVIVRVNDRGPFVKGRIVDLSYAAAQKLGVVGVATVKLVRITPEQIRRGQWQANPLAAPAAAAAPAPEQAQGQCRVCLTPPGV